MYFRSVIRELDRWFEVLSKRNLIVERNEKQLKEVANLAKRCVKVKGEDMPTMKEVAAEV